MYLENKEPSYADLMQACADAYAAGQETMTPAVADVCYAYNLPEWMFDDLCRDVNKWNTTR